MTLFIKIHEIIHVCNIIGHIAVDLVEDINRGKTFYDTRNHFHYDCSKNTNENK